MEEKGWTPPRVSDDAIMLRGDIIHYTDGGVLVIDGYHGKPVGYLRGHLYSKDVVYIERSSDGE